MSNQKAMNIRRSKREDHADARERRKTTALACLVLALVLLVGVFGALISRFNGLLHDNYQLEQRNHIITCNIYGRVSDGQRLPDCSDVPITGGRR